MKSSLRFIAHFFRNYPRQSALMVMWSVLAGFAEGLGLISLIPLLELFVEESSGKGLPIADFVRDTFTSAGLEPTLGVLLSGVVILAVLKAAFMLLTIRQLGYTIASVTTDLRLQLLAVLMRAKWRYFIGQPSGRLTNAIGFETAKAAGAYKEIVNLVAGMISVFIYLLVAFFVSWWIVVTALFVGFVFMFLAKSLIRLSRDSGLKQTKVMKKLSSQMVDALHGIKAIKAMGREKQLWTLLEDETHELNNAQRQRVIAVGTLEVMREPVVIGALSVGLFVILTYTTQPFTAVLILAFLFNRVLTRVTMLQKTYQAMVTGESAFWSLKQTIDRAVTQTERFVESSHQPTLEKGLRFDGVGFNYGDRPILSNVNLSIPAGKLVVVVGPSGVGKTTLVDLILGLHVPDTGSIYIDDKALADINIHAWRSCIGYVPQEMFLFHESIYKNVTLGDTTFSREECEQALAAAGAADFVRQMPNGIDSVVGERGSRVSGGQRQRIALARALVHKPKLLVLDEVTAGLDAVTEEEICKTLRDLRGAATIIAVSHQQALLAASDLVIEVRESGVTVADAATGSLAADLG